MVVLPCAATDLIDRPLSTDLAFPTDSREANPFSAVPARARTGPSRTWHNDGMNRTRLSTTVDATLLADARKVRSGISDAALIDAALTALLHRHRSAEVDASYAAYDQHPVDEPDEWGDLASWRAAAASS
jgi:hypothetical protein